MVSRFRLENNNRLGIIRLRKLESIVMKLFCFNFNYLNIIKMKLCNSEGNFRIITPGDNCFPKMLLQSRASFYSPDY